MTTKQDKATIDEEAAAEVAYQKKATTPFVAHVKFSVFDRLTDGWKVERTSLGWNVTDPSGGHGFSPHTYAQHSHRPTTATTGTFAPNTHPDANIKTVSPVITETRLDGSITTTPAPLAVVVRSRAEHDIGEAIKNIGATVVPFEGRRIMTRVDGTKVELDPSLVPKDDAVVGAPELSK